MLPKVGLLGACTGENQLNIVPMLALGHRIQQHLMGFFPAVAPGEQHHIFPFQLRGPGDGNGVEVRADAVGDDPSLRMAHNGLKGIPDELGGVVDEVTELIQPLI